MNVWFIVFPVISSLDIASVSENLRFQRASNGSPIGLTFFLWEGKKAYAQVDLTVNVLSI